MGSWFSNLHIRKNEAVTKENVAAYIRRIMAAQGFLPVATEGEADAAFAVLDGENASWISVYSDFVTLEDPAQFGNIARPMSAELGADVLGIACFDSDYLCLSLINAGDKTDAWAGVGSAAGLGIRRRTNLSAWRKKILDFASYKNSIRKKYDFAEDVLAEIEPSLELPQMRSMADYETLEELGLRDVADYLWFKKPETVKNCEPPRLTLHCAPGTPCFPDHPFVVDALNVGGAARGLSVYFLGPWVEKNDLTLAEVSFVTSRKGEHKHKPFRPEKIQLPDGQWALFHHDPGFRIPPKVAESLPLMKRAHTDMDNSFGVRFMPRGNCRKVLDITVVLVPDKNPAGQTVWNVWAPFGSKTAYIRHHNETWSRHPGAKDMMLREEDFD